MLPVFEKSTPALPFFLGGGFLAAAKMPAGDSLLTAGPAVLVRAGPKQRLSDGDARRSSSASRMAPVVISPVARADPFQQEPRASLRKRRRARGGGGGAAG